ncbi:type II toxin-antitoxin system PemK/MazF family toxin [Candidatus Pacearchaeota archaeon]|nr:type II toxin-antitoxin system PemK/MazF family toxin [Candidatus Pacearchaeota archaeon]
MRVKRGDIVLANLEPAIGSEQGSIRPVLIIQNNVSNEYSPITIIAPITTKIYEKDYPTNVFVERRYSKLNKDSTILLNQIRAIDKSRIKRFISLLNEEVMSEVDTAIKISLGLA